MYQLIQERIDQLEITKMGVYLGVSNIWSQSLDAPRTLHHYLCLHSVTCCLPAGQLFPWGQKHGGQFLVAVTYDGMFH